MLSHAVISEAKVAHAAGQILDLVGWHTFLETTICASSWATEGTYMI